MLLIKDALKVRAYKATGPGERGAATGQRAAAAKKGPIGKRPGPAAETRDIRVPVHHIWVMAEGRFISFVSFRRQVGSPGFPKTYGRAARPVGRFHDPIPQYHQLGCVEPGAGLAFAGPGT